VTINTDASLSMWPTSWSRTPCDSIAVAQNAPAIKVNCPDCSAVISLDVSDTGHLRYVCQIGHAYSVEELSIAKKALGSMSTDALRARLKESEHQREALRQLLEQSTGLSLALVTYILATQCRIL
jgi:hypothetical protein